MAETERTYSSLINLLSDSAAAHSTNRQLIRDIVKSLHLFPTLSGEIEVVSERYAYGDVRRYGADLTGATSSRAAAINALTSASALGTDAFLPAGSIEVGTGLPMSGFTASLIGADPKRTIIKASTQAGPVVDMSGWLGSVANNAAQRRFGNFAIEGGNSADATKANVGLNAAGMAGVKFYNIGISKTGGPCLKLGAQWGNIFEGVTLNQPVGANTNDVPYLHATDWVNGSVFLGIGFRSLNVSAEGSSVVLFEAVTSQSHDTTFISPWFEFLHLPEGGRIFDMLTAGVVIEDPQIFDSQDAVASADTAACVFRGGGNVWRGKVPGRGTVAENTRYGVILAASRNTVVGVRGFRDNNVRLDAGVQYSYVELGGSESGTGTASAIIDNSGDSTNVLLDHTSRSYRYGTASMELAQRTDPTAPATGTASVWAKSVNGGIQLRVMGSDGVVQGLKSVGAATTQTLSTGLTATADHDGTVILFNTTASARTLTLSNTLPRGWTITAGKSAGGANSPVTITGTSCTFNSPTVQAATSLSIYTIGKKFTLFHVGSGVFEVISESAVLNAANGETCVEGYNSELLTLSTSGATTDTTANLLPANSIIEAVVARITTTITTATDWKLGDATTAGRFTAASASMAAGTSVVGLVHVDQTGSAGPRQTAAAKVRVTTTGTPGAGAIRITVFYRQFTAPTS